MNDEKVVLPPTYYLTYFEYLIRFTEERSGNLLREKDHIFIRKFTGLSQDARCLFIRFINRKGPFFRVSKLSYEEINDISAALQELEENGFLSFPNEENVEVISLFRRDELINIFDLPKNLKKSDLVDIVSGESDWLPSLLSHDSLVAPFYLDEVEYIKLLFFGKYQTPMTEFVIRDIGNVKLESLDDKKFTPWFESPREAQAVYELSKLNSVIKKAIAIFPPEQLDQLLSIVDWEAVKPLKKARPLVDKILMRACAQLERDQALKVALKYYRYTHKPPSRERQIRILDSLGRENEAKDLAISLMDTYSNAAERVFAKDYLNRQKKRINRSMTKRIEKAENIALKDYDPFKPIERQVLSYFKKQGYNGMHSENYLWKNTFGLVFWEELYNQNYQRYHHPLQRISEDIFDPERVGARLTLFEDKLRKLTSKEKLIHALEGKIKEKYGVSNPFVYWQEELFGHLSLFVDYVPLDGLRSTLLEISKNPRENCTGFPDLFLWKEKEYRFYEVKSPNDHLSPQQLHWLDFFSEVGIRSNVLKVKLD